MSTLSSGPVIAEVVRGGTVESIHHGLVVVTSPSGSVEFALGDPEVSVYPRSALKPVQALAMLASGLRLNPRQLALACASHSGTAEHLDVVRSTLADAGLPLEALHNTPDLPYAPAERAAWLAAGRSPSSLAQNCSGKHAAMVAACRHNGWDVETYLDADHPCQTLVADAITDLGVEVRGASVDGCGAQCFLIGLADLARIFGGLAAAGDGAAREVADAMRAHPELVGGDGRTATRIMQQAPGVVAKDGAEAVFALGLPDGRGVALKIADGSERAVPVVVAALLRRLGVGPVALWDALAEAPVLGHGRPVGEVRATTL